MDLGPGQKLKTVLMQHIPIIKDIFLPDLQISVEGSPGDVFGVIFAAQGSKSTYKSLLLYSITLRNPLFAELAASDKVCMTGNFFNEPMFYDKP